MWKWAVRVSVLAGLTAPLLGVEPKLCTPFEKAKDLIGQQGCVVGRVVKVSQSQAGNTYVNFCREYRGCGFSVVSLKKDDSLGDLRDLQGKMVEFHGTIENYEGQPEIKLTSRGQMRLTEDKEEAANLEEEPPDDPARMHKFGDKPHVGMRAPHHNSGRAQ